MIGIIKLNVKVVNIALLAIATSISVLAQAQRTAAPDANGPALGYFAIAVVVVVLTAAGILGIRLLRNYEFAGTEGVSGTTEQPLKAGEFRVTYTENKEGSSMLGNEVQRSGLPRTNTDTPQLPIYSFVRLERSCPFKQLRDSRDEALQRAIDHTQEESGEDAESRSLALNVLAASRTSNSISAISQMALYDLSSKLRSNAVKVLAEFDHESVFETIVAACADPTREVRAAAARSLFRLSFDRAHAWTRIIESNDVGRMRQAARAALEGDLVERSFDRLVHQDGKVAYEAYALTALLIKAGETEPIYRSLAVHKNEEVKLALLHVLRTIRNESTFDSLGDLISCHDLTPRITAKINEVRSCSQLMSV